HANQHRVLDRARVYHGGVADGDVGADDGGEAAGRVLAVVGDVVEGAVLDVGAGADADVVHVAAHDGAGPERGVVAQDDVAEHGCGRDHGRRQTGVWARSTGG